jgi:hypothetical protein
MAATQKWLTSREHEVRCPWCGHKNNFKEIAFESGLGRYENGMTVECDQPAQGGCGRHMEVVKVEPTTLISVRKANGPRGVPTSIGGR